MPFFEGRTLKNAVGRHDRSIMNEELLIKMGLDSSAMATGIRGVKGMLSEFGSEISAKFASVASVGAVAVTLEKALERAREIKRVSEELGVSPKFVQDLQNIAAVTGVSRSR